MRFEVNVLGAKSDMIIEYIERLPEGARVSVRGLSKELGVSEGTAFKAIRLADERGLVETRPRAGTVRKHKVRLPLRWPLKRGDWALRCWPGRTIWTFP